MISDICVYVISVCIWLSLFVSRGGWKALVYLSKKGPIYTILAILFLILILYLVDSYLDKRKKKLTNLSGRTPLSDLVSVESTTKTWSDVENDIVSDLSHRKLSKIYTKSEKKYKTEEKCKTIIEKLFNRSFNKCRPDFLKNPKTGRNLELDMYNSDLKLAIEYNGIQHRVYTPYYHKSINDFYDQQYRDEFKKHRCKEMGINLISIPDTVRYEDLEKYITDCLDKMNISIF